MFTTSEGCCSVVMWRLRHVIIKYVVISLSAINLHLFWMWWYAKHPIRWNAIPVRSCKHSVWGCFHQMVGQKHHRSENHQIKKQPKIKIKSKEWPKNNSLEIKSECKQKVQCCVRTHDLNPQSIDVPSLLLLSFHHVSKNRQTHT